MRKYSYVAPETLNDVFRVVAENPDKEVRFVAGGTDFTPRLNAELDQVPHGEKPEMVIVSIAKLGLDQVTECEDGVMVGACCTLNDLTENTIIRTVFPVLPQTIAEIAGQTVRNTGTLGGNIVNASPAADSVPALIALGAKFVVKSAAATKTVAAEAFFVGPGKTILKPDEVLTEIVIPKGCGKASFRKLGRRKAETLSTVNAAAYVESKNGVCTAIRVAVGAVAPTVVRCGVVEEALLGKELTTENIEAAAKKVVETISPIDDIRASAWYRKKIAPVMVKRVIEDSV